MNKTKLLFYLGVCLLLLAASLLIHWMTGEGSILIGFIFSLVFPAMLIYKDWQEWRKGFYKGYPSKVFDPKEGKIIPNPDLTWSNFWSVGLSPVVPSQVPTTIGSIPVNMIPLLFGVYAFSSLVGWILSLTLIQTLLLSLTLCLLASVLERLVSKLSN